MNTTPNDQLPAPLTPVDIDVRDFDSFMLNAERLLASELWALSSGEEFKAAVGLWCRAWKQTPAGSLPNDDRILASFAGVSMKRWGKIRTVAMRGFVLCSDGRLYHPVLCEDVVRAYAKKRVGSDKGKKGAQARWGKPKSDAPVMPKHDPGNAKAMPNDGHRQGHRQGHTPLPPEGDGRNDVERAFGDAGIGGSEAAQAGPEPDHPDYVAIVLRFGFAETMGPNRKRKLNAMLHAVGPEIVAKALEDAILNHAEDPIHYASPQVNREHAKRIQAKTRTRPAARAFVDGAAKPTSASPIQAIAGKASAK